MELIYLLPAPPPSHWRHRHWRCRRPPSTCTAPPRCPSRCRRRRAPPPHRRHRGGTWRVGPPRMRRVVVAGGGGAADVIVVVAVLATIVGSESLSRGLIKCCFFWQRDWHSARCTHETPPNRVFADSLNRDPSRGCIGVPLIPFPREVTTSGPAVIL